MIRNKQNLLIVLSLSVFILYTVGIIVHQYAISSMENILNMSGLEKTVWYCINFALVIFSCGILIGIRNFSLVISGNNELRKEPWSYVLYYAWVIVFILIFAAVLFQLVDFVQSLNDRYNYSGSFWYILKQISYDLAKGLFWTGILAALWFLTAPGGRHDPYACVRRRRLKQRFSERSFWLHCSRCRREILNEWRVCPYCGEKQFLEENYNHK